MILTIAIVCPLFVLILLLDLIDSARFFCKSDQVLPLFLNHSPVKTDPFQCQNICAIIALPGFLLVFCVLKPFRRSPLSSFCIFSIINPQSPILILQSSICNLQSPILNLLPSHVRYCPFRFPPGSTSSTSKPQTQSLPRAKARRPARQRQRLPSRALFQPYPPPSRRSVPVIF